MQQTTNYNLKKIELTDSPPDITVINPNWDTIDTAIKAVDNNLVAHKADLTKYALFKMSANASIPSTEYTQIPLATKTPYNGENFCEIDVATKRIKILKAGMYQVQVQIAFNPSVTGARMYWGDTTTHSFLTPAGGAFYQSVTEFVYATAGQLLNNRVYQTSGSPLDLQATNTLVYIRKVV